MNRVTAKGVLYKDAKGSFTINLKGTDNPDGGSVTAAGLAVLALNASGLLVNVDTGMDGGVPVALCSTGVIVYKDMTNWVPNSGNVLSNVHAILIAEVRQEGPFGAVGLRFLDPATGEVIKQTQDADGNYVAVPLISGSVSILQAAA